MVPDRASLDTGDLLKIVLVLVIVWLAVSILSDILGLFRGPLGTVVGLVLLAVLALWYFDVI